MLKGAKAGSGIHRAYVDRRCSDGVMDSATRLFNWSGCPGRRNDPPKTPATPAELEAHIKKVRTGTVGYGIPMIVLG
jgi:hypothetical protein